MMHVSFRTLSRNRYRCVQTGKVVKKAALDGYRNYLLNKDRHELPPLPAIYHPAQAISSSDFWQSGDRHKEIW